MAENKINNLRQPNAGFERTDRLAMVPPGCEPGGPGAVSVWVEGVPAPQGSKRAFQPRGRGGKIVLVEQAKGVKLWRQQVRQAFLDRPYGASVLMPFPKDTPVVVKIVFVLPRTQAMRSKPSADVPMVQKPDTDKLVRAVLDALSHKTGAGVYVDDSQVVTVHAHKRRAEPGEPTGAMVHVERDGDRSCTGCVTGNGDHRHGCTVSPEEKIKFGGPTGIVQAVLGPLLDKPGQTP